LGKGGQLIVFLMWPRDKTGRHQRRPSANERG
jgi:hypothetical protein